MADTDTSDDGTPALSADDVAAYLKAHPDFLAQHPAVLDTLQIPPRQSGAGVVDMQAAMVKRLRANIDKLRAVQQELISAGRANQITQNRVHVAVLSVIQATSFEKLIHTVTHELPGLLDVDFIALAIEGTEDAPRRVPVRGVYVLAPGAIDAALGPGESARLRGDIIGEEAFFGPVARHVRSDVLVRLRVSSGSPDGVIAFGSRQGSTFGPNQSTELLFFLTRVLENTIRAWLDLPE
ncbi:DUF484 family protein [Vineibacter terrae]|uniref:DUF484 family protein n=1 Tax=Vineibacter terrae TaxID=2586908 RepID=A0A5C8PER1_9HYPH|nr:DUF484 family protein [Vineibacter terrae]TXL72096.1 DUF484 family protein [Vineibacter terrae]HEX2890139.1 DUF484 family protein [Vineibacter terrae]